MSAALQLPVVWGSAAPETVWKEIRRQRAEGKREPAAVQIPAKAPDISLAFYRKHTESILRRYLYASSVVGRTPELLRDSVGRGWASSRPIRSFEDAVIFVLDVESCINKLNALDRGLLMRIVLQDYTQAETAEMLGLSLRNVTCKFPVAMDRLTRYLLDAGLLVIPH